MILKSSSRAGPIDLALHLSNRVENTSVIVKEVRGAVSSELIGAFREWQILSEQTQCKKPLYSLSISPDPMLREWTDQEWQKTIDHIEKRLGLSGQPRAIVFHEKIGDADGELRKHCHVVWSRITPELKAVHMSKDRYVLQQCARALAKEFRLNLRWNKGKENGYDFAKSHAQNRDVETSKERKATITSLWQQHTDPKQFAIAMNQAGFIVASGDRRSFVIVDSDFQVHSIARQIHNTKTKEVKDRLGSSDDYPTVEQAKEEQKIKAHTQAQKTSKTKQKRSDLTREQKLYKKLQAMARRADKLHIKRRQQLKAKIATAKIRHAEQVLKQAERFKRKMKKIEAMRQRHEPKGVKRYLQIAIGYDRLLQWKYAAQNQQLLKTFEADKNALKKAHSQERKRLENYKTRIEQQERREAKSIQRLASKLGLNYRKPYHHLDKETLERLSLAPRKQQDRHHATLML